MNARQKAKRLKAELKALKEYYGNVKRYKVRQTVETEYLNTESTDEKSPQMYINFALSRKLSEILINEIEFKLTPSIINGYTEITGEIAIVTKDRCNK